MDTANHKRDFVTVQELSEGFSEFSLPQTPDFVGQKMELFYEDGQQVSYEFLDMETIKFTYCDNVHSAIYHAVSPREGIYFIDFIYSYGETKSITTVVDVNKKIATTAIGTMPTQGEVAVSQFERGDKGLPLTSVKVEFKHAALNEPFSAATPKHQPTADLVGERIQFVYSTNDVYEHIYLNENFYTWHCLKGIEKGLCDTDRCFYWKLADQLYWFLWLERIVPTFGSVVEDLAKMRSYGKIYGYESYDMDKVKNFPAGSYAKVLNRTKYDFD